MTLSPCIAICQSVAEVQLTGVTPLTAATDFNFNFFNIFKTIKIPLLYVEKKKYWADT